ncbi:MAG: DNA polymerase III subunit alpha, partial [Bacteroidales bacterium]|nr:DNA polymerase III subunit alpha [Bacteroidales bacterium]
IMKEAVANIKKSKGIDLDINSIPIDDKETYKIFCAGKTIGIFQFESPGMQKYLRELQPSVIEDLIAMNALYRPGPIAYIPQFIARKHGKEPITYDIPIMEKYLKDTYGITVYQEQVMLLSRLLADFTRGESDALRKAMGKKKKDIVDAMKPKFIEGGKKNGHDPKVLEKIWSDWESFASYAFNKSHAACYAWVSYQTAYLKAHYPAEFMAANLTLNKDDITEVTKLMSECKSMKINVLLPDVNESDLNFTVTKSGDIRFGLGGVKGVGEGAVMSIISEREANGPYKDIFDFVSRVNLQSVNKKTIEALAFGGAFDSFNTPTNPNSTSRDQIVSDFGEKGESSLDMLIKFGRSVQQQKNDNTMSLFGATTSFSIALPKLPPRIDKMMYMPILLKNEYSVLGIYLSSHPLDKFKFFIDNSNIAHLDIAAKVIEEKNSKTKFTVVGYITKSTERTSKNGNFFGEYTIIDYYGELKFALFGKDYTAYKANLVEGHSIIMDVEIKERNFFNNDKKKDDKNKEIILSAVYSNIRPLQDVDIKSINMYFDTDGIDSNFRKEFYNIIEKCKGKTELCITLVSGSSMNKGIKMVSRTKLIDVNNDEINQFIKNNPSVIKKVSITQ